MAWTAELLDFSKTESMIVATVAFEDKATGERVVRKVSGDNLDADQLAAQCQRIIESFEARDVAMPTLAKGPIALPRDAKPTEEQAKEDAAIFFEKLVKLRALQKALADGLIKADDADLAALTADVKATFLPEYSFDPRMRG